MEGLSLDDQPCSMLQLPLDVWGTILQTLQDDEDGRAHLAALRSVCSRVRTAVDASVLHHRTRSGPDSTELVAFLQRSPGA